MYAHFHPKAGLRQFDKISCPRYVNVNDIYKQEDRLFGTETLCGDYHGRLLVLAQDFACAENIRTSASKKNPFAHYPALATNISLVDILRRTGFDVSIDGAGAVKCDAVYGSIIWLLKDTDRNSGPLPNRVKAIAASTPVIKHVIDSMPRLRRVVCLGAVAYEGLASMCGHTRSWSADIISESSYAIGKSVKVFPTSHTSPLGLMNRMRVEAKISRKLQKPRVEAHRHNTLDLIAHDFERALMSR